jgi:hypothetical protein
MHFLATSTVLINFDKLPDAAIDEIAALNDLSGDRRTVLKGLQDIVHRSTYDELDPILTGITRIAQKHRVPDAIRSSVR